MEGNVVEQMVAGIDDSAIAVVFVTKRYMEKVAQHENPNDNCKREFGYSVRKKTTNRIVTVVMEERMRNSSDWTGAVGMELGGQLYHDLSGEGERVDETTVEHIAEEIIRLRDRERETSRRGALPPANKEGLATLLRKADLEACLAPLLAFGVESRADLVHHFAEGDAESLEVLNRNPQPSTLKPQPSTLHPQPSTLNPQPSTLIPQPSTLNPQPSTLNPQPSTLNRQPSTLHPPPSPPRP